MAVATQNCLQLEKESYHADGSGIGEIGSVVVFYYPRLRGRLQLQVQTNRTKC